jgi:lycopene cyclase domain-containing protein
MNYTELNAGFLWIAFAFFFVAFLVIGIQMRRRRREVRSLAPGSAGIFGQGQSDDLPTKRRPNLGAKYALTLIVLMVFTAVFDNLIIGAGIVAYDPTKISGVFIGIAPIEDFAYTLAAVLILPTLWGLLGHFGPLKGRPTEGSSGQKR